MQIYAEHFQPVEHNLLVKEEATLKDIKFIRSHAQAIDQCQKIIQKHKFKTIISADTAGSAKELSKGSDKSIGAIASTLSAEIYKLKILLKNIEDEKNNVTRFLIMGKKLPNQYLKKIKNILQAVYLG